MRKPYSRCDRLLVLLCALGCGPLAMAAPTDAAAPTEDLDAAVLGLVDNGTVDPWSEQPVVLAQPARVRHELGAVIDARPADGGLPRVMAITPGGAADRMRLAVGDRLLAVHGEPLSGGDAAEILRRGVQDDARPLALQVQRGSAVLEVEGYVDRVDVPAYRLEVQPSAARGSCARISQTLTPPRSEQLFPAVLHEIDGRLPGPLSNDTFRVKPGRRVLKITEAIPAREFRGSENQRRSGLMRHERFKYLTIDVQPDTIYWIGVKFDQDKTQPVRDQAYWEPVVWKSRPQACR
jgi:hypothetical protein